MPTNSVTNIALNNAESPSNNQISLSINHTLSSTIVSISRTPRNDFFPIDEATLLAFFTFIDRLRLPLPLRLHLVVLSFVVRHQFVEVGL